MQHLGDFVKLMCKDILYIHSYYENTLRKVARHGLNQLKENKAYNIIDLF